VLSACFSNIAAQRVGASGVSGGDDIEVVVGSAL
jgi:hypothetical protein